ncbi:MAG: hypothetical protein IAF08_03490, partial [Rhizobacter sp.]|nr:hypothetical protein [Chlorobiales bacterium]
MCGIAGTIGFANEPLLERMTNVIAHRGPDDRGTKIFTRDHLSVGFGFRRLSIIDLSPAGHQPMQTTYFNSSNNSSQAHGSQSGIGTSPDESLWIIFNGEIYNYEPLRDELRAKGYTFKSGTDTEVILHAYHAWGTDCVKRFNGMWGFAIYDLKKNRVFISRDRLGVKPIYYARLSGGRIIFGSEVKSLLECSDVPREADPDGILSTLFFLWTPEPKTAFKGIEKLPAGCNMIIEQGDVRIEKYWDLTFEGYGT